MGDEQKVSAAPLKASNAMLHGVAVKKQKTLKSSAQGHYNTKWGSDLRFKPEAKEELTENPTTELVDLHQTKLMYEFSASTTQFTNNGELCAKMEASSNIGSHYEDGHYD